MGNQEQHNLEQTNNSKKEADLKELILVIQGLFRFLLSKWMIISFVLIIGAILGGIYSKIGKTTYLATSTFVLENGQSNSMAGLSIFGFGGKSNSGLFEETGNILWLYKTRSMLQQSLLTIGKRNGKDVVMIEWFMDAAGMRKAISKSPTLAKLKFNINDDFTNLSIEQNALIGWCVGELGSKYLMIKNVDKTENIINVTIKSRDEAFAKAFNDILVNTVNNFYIETKTQKATKEVRLLEQKLDSFKVKMNLAMNQAAVASDNVPYANPNQQVLRLAPQKKSVDVQIESSLFMELSKNLELSKIDLAKITPLIKVIEKPNLPLASESRVFSNCIIYGGIICTLITIIILSIIFFYKKIMA